MEEFSESKICLSYFFFFKCEHQHCFILLLFSIINLKLVLFVIKPMIFSMILMLKVSY